MFKIRVVRHESGEGTPHGVDTGAVERHVHHGVHVHPRVGRDHFGDAEHPERGVGVLLPEAVRERHAELVVGGEVIPAGDLPGHLFPHRWVLAVGPYASESVDEVSEGVGVADDPDPPTQS